MTASHYRPFGVGSATTAVGSPTTAIRYPPTAVGCPRTVELRLTDASSVPFFWGLVTALAMGGLALHCSTVVQSCTLPQPQVAYGDRNGDRNGMR